MGCYSKQNKTKTHFTATVEERSKQDEDWGLLCKDDILSSCPSPCPWEDSFVILAYPSLRVSSRYQTGWHRRGNKLETHENLYKNIRSTISNKIFKEVLKESDSGLRPEPDQAKKGRRV